MPTWFLLLLWRSTQAFRSICFYVLASSRLHSVHLVSPKSMDHGLINNILSFKPNASILYCTEEFAWHLALCESHQLLLLVIFAFNEYCCSGAASKEGSWGQKCCLWFYWSILPFICFTISFMVGNFCALGAALRGRASVTGWRRWAKLATNFGDLCLWDSSVRLHDFGMKQEVLEEDRGINSKVQKMSRSRSVLWMIQYFPN